LEREEGEERRRERGAPPPTSALGRATYRVRAPPPHDITLLSTREG
jgi:hypothetical protein